MEPKETRTIYRAEEQSNDPSSSVYSYLFNIQWQTAPGPWVTTVVNASRTTPRGNVERGFLRLGDVVLIYFNAACSLTTE